MLGIENLNVNVKTASVVLTQHSRSRKTRKVADRDSLSRPKCKMVYYGETAKLQWTEVLLMPEPDWQVTV